MNVTDIASRRGEVDSVFDVLQKDASRLFGLWSLISRSITSTTPAFRQAVDQAAIADPSRGAEQLKRRRDRCRQQAHHGHQRSAAIQRARGDADGNLLRAAKLKPSSSRARRSLHNLAQATAAG
jgi:hypothetical protein